MNAFIILAAMTVGQVSVDKNDFKVVGDHPSTTKVVIPKEDFPQVVGGIELKPIPAEPVRQTPKRKQPPWVEPQEAVVVPQQQVIVAPRVDLRVIRQVVPQQYYLQQAPVIRYGGFGTAYCPPGGS